MPTLTLERQNVYRARYAAAMRTWQAATHVYEMLIRQHLPVGGQLIDVGCGRGGVLEQLTDQSNLRACGFDLDELSVREHRLPQLPRAVAGADALPLPDGCVNVVICAWMLEHVAQPRTVFQEISRVLRKGGVFIFLTPNAFSPIPQVNRLLRHWQHVLVPRLYGRAEADTFPVVYRANSVPQLQTLAQAVGMQLEVCQQIHDPTYLAFNDVFYHLSVAATRVMPRHLALHLVGVARKQG
jgi:ubiquinone/menaquinone biosynthesis C-methylase UbiE